MEIRVVTVNHFQNTLMEPNVMIEPMFRPDGEEDEKIINSYDEL